MKIKIFSENEIKQLRRNKYIKNVSSKAITYTDEFKENFIAGVNSGKFPRQIFEDAGFDINIIGKNRMEKCAYRWRQKYKSGKELKDERKGHSGRVLKRELSLEEQIKRLEAKNRLLELENELLKKVAQEERRLIKEQKKR